MSTSINKAEQVDNLLVDQLKHNVRIATDRFMAAFQNIIMILSIAFMIFLVITHGEIDKFTYLDTNLSEIFYNGKLNVELFDIKEGNHLLTEEIKEFMNKHKDFDEMDILNSFVYVLHSSYLVCINHINKVNAALNYIIRYDAFKLLPNIGILITFIIVILSVLLNTGALSSMIQQMFTIHSSSSSQYITKILYHMVSSFVFLFTLYLVTSSCIYFWYLLWGVISTASENSSAVLRFFYGALLIIPFLVLFKGLLFKEGMNMPQCKDNSSLSIILFVLLIPLIASIRGVFMLVSNGFMGLPAFFIECTLEKRNLLRKTFWYAVLLISIYTIIPLITDIFIPQILKATRSYELLKVYNSYLPKSI